MRVEYMRDEYSSWIKYIAIFYYISKLKIRDKRNIFSIIRNTPEIDCSFYFPHYGFTASEFSVWYVVCDFSKRSLKSKGNKL